MNCKSCGAPLNEAIAFCTNCGAKAEKPSSSPASMSPPSPRTNAEGVEGEMMGDCFKIHRRPALSVVTVYLRDEESILAESGAMVAMSPNIDLQSEMKGGVLGAFKRAVTSESLFQSTFTAKESPGEVLFAPSM